MTSREKAELMLEAWTGGRSTDAEGYKAERVSKVIDLMADELEKRASQPANLQSVHNDKYSETYAVVTDKDFEESLKTKAFELLSGTGLMGCL